MDYAAPYRGNFIPSIECIENHWGDNGRFVFLFPDVAESITWVQNMKATGKTVYFIDRTFFSKKIKFVNIQKLRTLVLNENIQVIHTHFISYNYTLFIFTKFMNPGIRIVAHFHNNYQPTGRLALLKSWVMKRTSDFFIGVSESVSESLYSIGIKKDKISTVRNSVHFKRLDTFEVINLTNVEKNPLILMCGYPWHRKGVDIVVKAINNLNVQKEWKVKLVIASAGCREETVNGIKLALGFLPEWVEFLSPREDMATYYNAADIFISAGREEGLSYSPIEAAYCKCLVICSNIPGNPLDIPGMPIYEVEDIDDLQRKISELMKLSNSEKHDIKNNQRLFVVSNYSLDTWANEIIKCY